jgi:hypothetical protein
LQHEVTMGWLIPRTYLHWREPALVRRTREAAEEKALPRLLRPALVLLCTGLLLLQWYFATLNPNKQPRPLWQVLPVAVGFGLLLVYVLPLLYRLCPSSIRVTDAGLARVVGNHARVWKYRDLRSCRVVSEGAVSVLELTTGGGQAVILGIAPSVPLEELCEVLAGCGVQVNRLTIEDPALPLTASGGQSR